MNIAVWDTYVKRDNDKTMHFDILVPSEMKDEQTIFDYGKQYLKSKPFQTGQLTTNECRFCHIEQANKEIIETITKNGYSIIEMENCN
ncbi:uncharacterized protein DUF2024 [Flavobacteriaceae bacterium MAR_2010_72]|nr:uncharacterized protein DUF2024 [Flavobacteriaceae bacterium MAR_2010_72]